MDIPYIIYGSSVTEQWSTNQVLLSVYPWKAVLLCFDHETDGYNQCHSFDGAVFRRESNSTYPHRSTLGFASYQGQGSTDKANSQGHRFFGKVLYKPCEGQPFTTGSLNPRNLKTEIMDLSTKEWRDAANYPFATSTLWVFFLSSDNTINNC